MLTRVTGTEDFDGYRLTAFFSVVGTIDGRIVMSGDALAAREAEEAGTLDALTRTLATARSGVQPAK